MIIEFLSKRIANYIEHEIIDSFMARCACYNAINCVFQVCEAKKPGWIKIVSKDAASNISNFYVEELLLIFRSMCSQLILEIGEQAAGKKKMSMEDVTLYIDKHFDEPDMSAKTLAAVFSLTMSNFSHQFKNYTGKPISVYINEKRIEHAKYLLRQGDCSVADIAAHSGFLYVSSFIRRFKQIEGVTPGEYQEKRKHFEIPNEQT